MTETTKKPMSARTRKRLTHLEKKVDGPEKQETFQALLEKASTLLQIEDKRSYEQMAHEHAKWLAATVAHVVKTTRESLRFTPSWSEDIRKALYHAAYASFLRGAYGTALSTRPFAACVLDDLAAEQADKATQWAWEKLVAEHEHNHSTPLHISEVGVPAFERAFRLIVRENCAEICLHGAKHARRRLGMDHT